jgi:ATP-dependent helicase/nuclease subunit A
LLQPLALEPGSLQIAPSRTASLAEASGDGDPEGRTRGIAIHLMLERLSREPVPAPRQLPAGIAAMLHRDPADPELLAWWQEALAVYTNPALVNFYDPSGYRKAWNEVPVQYLVGDRLIYGIIDRLVLAGDAVHVIDYKTHRTATPATLQRLAGHYRDQLAYYARGAALLWPDCRIESFLLFTACNRLVKMESFHLPE